MFNLNPREDKFFEMFVEEAKNIHEAGKLLKRGFVELEDKEKISKEIGSLEHKGDKIVHDSIVELEDAFITPIDREDIYKLIKKNTLWGYVFIRLSIYICRIKEKK